MVDCCLLSNQVLSALDSVWPVLCVSGFGQKLPHASGDEVMSEADNSTPNAGAFKPKRSVALSGVTAGNTALCTVGKTGNDLHYRGYDILDIATECEFEEIAYLLVHEKLPNRVELAAYKAKLKALRLLPAAVATVLEQLPAGSHPMDVLRTGVSALGCCIAEANDHRSAR